MVNTSNNHFGPEITQITRLGEGDIGGVLGALRGSFLGKIVRFLTPSIINKVIDNLMYRACLAKIIKCSNELFKKTEMPSRSNSTPVPILGTQDYQAINASIETVYGKIFPFKNSSVQNDPIKKRGNLDKRAMQMLGKMFEKQLQSEKLSPDAAQFGGQLRSEGFSQNAARFGAEMIERRIGKSVARGRAEVVDQWDVVAGSNKELLQAHDATEYVAAFSTSNGYAIKGGFSEFPEGAQRSLLSRLKKRDDKPSDVYTQKQKLSDEQIDNDLQRAVIMIGEMIVTGAHETNAESGTLSPGDIRQKIRAFVEEKTAISDEADLNAITAFILEELDATNTITELNAAAEMGFGSEKIEATRPDARNTAMLPRLEVDSSGIRITHSTIRTITAFQDVDILGKVTVSRQLSITPQQILSKAIVLPDITVTPRLSETEKKADALLSALDHTRKRLINSLRGVSSELGKEKDGLNGDISALIGQLGAIENEGHSEATEAELRRIEESLSTLGGRISGLIAEKMIDGDKKAVEKVRSQLGAPGDINKLYTQIEKLQGSIIETYGYPQIKAEYEDIRDQINALMIDTWQMMLDVEEKTISSTMNLGKEILGDIQKKDALARFRLYFPGESTATNYNERMFKEGSLTDDDYKERAKDFAKKIETMAENMPAVDLRELTEDIIFFCTQASFGNAFNSLEMPMILKRGEESHVPFHETDSDVIPSSPKTISIFAKDEKIHIELESLERIIKMSDSDEIGKLILDRSNPEDVKRKIDEMTVEVVEKHAVLVIDPKKRRGEKGHLTYLEPPRVGRVDIAKLQSLYP